jgi:two-component system, cell cycle response regulator DivK
LRVSIAATGAFEECRELASNPDPARKRILVVEDNPLNRKLFTDLLEDRGYEVLQASTRAEAVRLGHEHHPDLILMDVRLPDGSGLEATRQLKRDDRTKEIPIIILTASPLDEDQAKARESGCDAFLSKPIVVRDFLLTVNEFLLHVPG